MTLLEMSVLYADSAARLRRRINELRAAAQAQADPEATCRLYQRIARLMPLLEETRDLASLTEHYYDSGCEKHAQSKL